MPVITIKDGDCAHSLAVAKGMTLDKVWFDSANSALRQKRANPHVLMAGDKLTLPDRTDGQESCETEKRHCFQRKGLRARLMLKIQRNDKPLGSADFILEVGNQSLQGVTGEDGSIDVHVPSDAKQATLRLANGKESYKLSLGYLDPIDEVSGYQARLHNLGFFPGPIDGIDGAKTKSAVRQFQSVVGATVDGIVGSETRKHLEERYGC